MSKYKVGTLTFKELNHRVIVPSFQRRLVWSEPQKKAFIETLKNGYPFGSILIYKYSSDSIDQDKYSLIDGLQRFSTIRDYYLNPTSYIDFKNIVDKLYCNLSINQSNSSTKEIKIMLEDALVRFTNLMMKNEITDKVYSLYRVLKGEEYNIQELSLILQNDSMDYYEEIIYPKLAPVVELVESELSNSSQIGELVIPTVEFIGDETELADVFHNLNRGGKKLSKYQVFAAQWSNLELKLPRGEHTDNLLAINIDRYNSLDESRDVKIYGFDSQQMLDNRVLNFAEVCFGLGTLIIKKLNVFIPSTNDILKNEDLANELGYSTMAATFGLSNRKLHELINFYNLFVKNEMLLEKYIDYVLSIYEDVNNEFKSYLKIPGKDSRYVGGGKTNFMLLSYFSTLWHIKFEIKHQAAEVKINSKYRHDYQKAKNNFILYYLQDQSSNFWSGTGDAKLDTISVDKQFRYLKPVDMNRLEQLLLDWNDQRTSYSSINFDDLSKTITTVIANLNGDIYYVEDKYDFEHIVSRKDLRSIYKKYNIPGGSLGNIMLLNSGKNRSKKEISLYDSNYEHQYYSEEFLKISNYPPKKTIENLYYTVKHESDKVYVNEYIIKRGKENIEILIRLLKKKYDY